MIIGEDIVSYTIDSQDNNLIISNAKKAQIGGQSQFRNSKDRINSIAEDQLVGQISTYAASIILTGNSAGYIKAREIANANPTKGDGGIDIIGLSNIDIKGSLMRYSSNPLNYRLLVRPKERHKNWIYVLGLVPKERPYKCHFVGWARDEDLPISTYNGSIQSIRGAYVLESCDLRKIRDLIKEIQNV